MVDVSVSLHPMLPIALFPRNSLAAYYSCMHLRLRLCKFASEFA